MAVVGTQTTNHETGDNTHIAVPPNDPRPTTTTAGAAGGITIRR